MATSDRMQRNRRGMSTLQELYLDKLNVHASALDELGDLPDAMAAGTELMRRQAGSLAAKS